MASVAPMSDRGTRALVVAKEGTGANTARTPDTETKVEGMKIDNEFSDLIITPFRNMSSKSVIITCL